MIYICIGAIFLIGILLYRAIKKTDSKIKLVKEEISKLNQISKKSNRIVMETIQPYRDNKLVIGNSIYQYLKEKQEPVSTEELVYVLKAKGFTSTSKNFKAIISSTLHRMQTKNQGIRNFGYKRWGLSEWEKDR